MKHLFKILFILIFSPINLGYAQIGPYGLVTRSYTVTVVNQSQVTFVSHLTGASAGYNTSFSAGPGMPSTQNPPGVNPSSTTSFSLLLVGGRSTLIYAYDPNNACLFRLNVKTLVSPTFPSGHTTVSSSAASGKKVVCGIVVSDSNATIQITIKAKAASFSSGPPQNVTLLIGNAGFTIGTNQNSQWIQPPLIFYGAVTTGAIQANNRFPNIPANTGSNDTTASVTIYPDQKMYIVYGWTPQLSCVFELTNGKTGISASALNTTQIAATPANELINSKQVDPNMSCQINTNTEGLSGSTIALGVGYAKPGAPTDWVPSALCVRYVKDNSLFSSVGTIISAAFDLSGISVGNILIDGNNSGTPDNLTDGHSQCWNYYSTIALTIFDALGNTLVTANTNSFDTNGAIQPGLINRINVSGDGLDDCDYPPTPQHTQGNAINATTYQGETNEPNWSGTC